MLLTCPLCRTIFDEMLYKDHFLFPVPRCMMRCSLLTELMYLFRQDQVSSAIEVMVSIQSGYTSMLPVNLQQAWILLQS